MKKSVSIFHNMKALWNAYFKFILFYIFHSSRGGRLLEFYSSFITLSWKIRARLRFFINRTILLDRWSEYAYEYFIGTVEAVTVDRCKLIEILLYRTLSSIYETSIFPSNTKSRILSDLYLYASRLNNLPL